MAIWPGPVYLWLRSSIVWLRRFPGRHWMRWIERNSDYQKMCLMGMPEFHIDPTKNRWRRGDSCGQQGDEKTWKVLVSEDLEGSALQESIIVNPSVFLCPKAPRQIGSIPWAGTTSTPATMAACWTRAMRISTATSCCTRQSPSSSTAPGAWCLLGWVALAPDQQIILWVI